MNKEHESIPLWRQLHATAGVVQVVREGRSGTVALEQVAVILRPGVQSLAFQVWRNLGRAQALRAQLARKAPPPAADALLCVCLALVWQPEQAPYDAFTLVNQAVEAAKRHPATRGQANFLNACLRRFLREQAALVALTDQDPVARWNHPAWWIGRLQREQPEHWERILEAANTHAPMSLRVNARQASVAAYLQRLRDAGINAHQGFTDSIVLAQPVPVSRLPGFSEGAVSVQDAAAQLAAPLLLDGLLNPRRILDACAAPGGKTGHLLEVCDAQVLALEVDAQRSLRIHDNLHRLGVQAEVRTADAAEPSQWWDGVFFDAILLDAPCTASGIVRRHPDVRWLRRETDIEQLAMLQAKMLRALWPLVKPGGRLLYCTCSVFTAEGETQVQTFLKHNTDAVLLPSPGHMRPTSSTRDGASLDNLDSDHDGFYYALLHKTVQ